MNNAPMSTQDIKSEIQRSWWMWLVWGIAAVIVGVLLITQPVITGLNIVIFIGFWWIVSGVIDVVTAIINRRGPWGWFIFTGIISVLAGIIFVTRPIISGVITLQIIYLTLAFSFIFTGIVRIFAGWRNHFGIGYTWTWGSLLVGIMLVVLGGLMLFNSDDAAFLTVLSMAAILAITSGVMSILFGFQVRSLK
ncbi:MAG: acid-resistance membrane protein [Chloroflexi bacterium OLB15]|nr:MAG: acid-resistance membrane protein [Chloroflexi bacterium OLB15]